MNLFFWKRRAPAVPEPVPAPAIPRLLEHETAPDLVYAIGDIHGGVALFERLEKAILADAKKRGGNAHIVVLGDFIDRGTGVRQIIDRFLAPLPPGITRTVLSGNHEAMMVDFLENPDIDHGWLRFGGHETLQSYGIESTRWKKDKVSGEDIAREIAANISPAHRAFVAERPWLIRFAGLVFVHGGIDRTKPLAEQSERDLLWRRPNPDEDTPGGPLVVHGHTPVKKAFVSEARINLDTGAYAGGPLTAGRFVKGSFDGVLTRKLKS